jgi:hypothetical protein
MSEKKKTHELNPRSKLSSDFSALSMYKLRLKIGLLAVFFPLIIAANLFFFERHWLEDSISHYYHTSSRNLFVGILCVVAFCFYLTPKYPKEPRSKDDWVGKLAALSLLGLVFFPTPLCKTATCSLQPWDYAHFVFATIFFCALAFFCLFLFVKSKRKADLLLPVKKKQNYVYRVCGGVIVFSMIFIGVYKMFKLSFLNSYSDIFFLESAAVIAFGIAWLVKSKSVPWFK